MKVQFTSNEKKIFTVAEMPAVRKLIEDMKEDTLPLKSYAKQALGCLCEVNGNSYDIVRCKASVAKNRRVWDRYFDGSETLDVWIEFLAFTPLLGALDCGVYLSEIWDIPADYDERRQYAATLENNMYIARYTQKR